MKNIIFLLFLWVTVAFSQTVKSPSEFLGYELGTEFTRHSDIVAYFQHVAQNSPLVTYQSYGTTYERRPLTYAVVSSANNIQDLEKIRTDNLKQTGILPGDAQPDIAIVWLSYNVHGNEASSSEAAMKTLYSLITDNQSFLQNTVVIIDPNVNPDGRDRYVNWYNQVRATPYDASQSATEHFEPWPGGRPNHYLFDLNRDWMWASQIETQQRLAIYNQWMPHIHVDFHEQGINDPYYFAPGAEPFHEIITPWQREFQTAIGKNNAKYFDQEGWLFFTRESFDLLYPSYGDTYPTFMGAIGMTYEKAGHGRAGLGIDTDEGYELTLADRILHHYTTGISTIEIASQNASRLNQEFKKFFDNSQLKYKSFVLTGSADKIKALTTLLDRHEIKYSFGSSGQAKGFQFSKNGSGQVSLQDALIISTHQPKGKMVHVLFEPEAQLSTPITYDITSWNLVYAYGLDGVASTQLITGTQHTRSMALVQNLPNPQAAGYITKWNSLQDARFLAELLKQNIRVRYSEKDFAVQGKNFKKGSLIITKSDNRNRSDFNEIVTQIANQYERELFASTTSFSDSGTDFGSHYVHLIHPPKIALVKGPGVNSLSYGALWHFFEQQLHFPVTSISTEHLERIDLSEFDVLILPSGHYGNVLKDSSKITQWVQQGGRLIAIDNALSSLEGIESLGLEKKSIESGEPTEEELLIPYDQQEKEWAKGLITGTIFKVPVDASHPVAFGYDDHYFTLKTNTHAYKYLQQGFTVSYIGKTPERISGFAGEEALEGIANTLIIGHATHGKGHVVYLVDDVMFRSFWENGKLFLVNAVFLLQKATYGL